MPVGVGTVVGTTVNVKELEVDKLTKALYFSSTGKIDPLPPSVAELVKHSDFKGTPLIQSNQNEIQHFKVKQSIEAAVVVEEVHPSLNNARETVQPIVHQHIQAGVALLYNQPPKPAIEALRKQLVMFYEAQYKDIKRIFGQTLPMDECFVNLSLVKEEKQRAKENLSFILDYEMEKLNSTYENCYQTDQHEAIEPKAIFEKRNRVEPKNLIVKGRAGIGKSTLSEYLCYQWAVHNLWPENIVFHIRLRNLTVGQYPSFPLDVNPLAYIIQKECIDSSQHPLQVKDIDATLEAAIDKVIIIFDGYDELPANSPCKKIVLDTIKSKRYRKLVTTRPYVEIDEKGFDARIECIGFTPRNIPEYIQKICQNNEKKANDIILFLKKNRTFFYLMHVPILLDLFCTVWDESMIGLTDLSMTELYHKIINKYFGYYNKKQLELHPELENNFEELARRTMKAREFLERLAFRAMAGNDILLSYNLIHETVIEVYGCADYNVMGYIKGLLTPGLLYAVGSGPLSTRQYYFPHLTIQEYFAGSYLANCFLKGAKINIWDKQKEVVTVTEFIKQYKYHPRYEVVWVIVAGLLGLNADHNLEHLEIFFNQILNEPRPILGFHQTKLMRRSYKEARTPIGTSKLKLIKGCYDRTVSLYSIFDSDPEMASALAQPSVCYDAPVFRDWRGQIAQTIQVDYTSPLHAQRIKELAQQIKDKETTPLEQRKAAFNQILVIGERMADLGIVNEELINCLLEVINDEDFKEDNVFDSVVIGRVKHTPILHNISVLDIINKLAQSHKDKKSIAGYWIECLENSRFFHSPEQYKLLNIAKSLGVSNVPVELILKIIRKDNNTLFIEVIVELYKAEVKSDSELNILLDILKHSNDENLIRRVIQVIIQAGLNSELIQIELVRLYKLTLNNYLKNDIAHALISLEFPIIEEMFSDLSKLLLSVLLKNDEIQKDYGVKRAINDLLKLALIKYKSKKELLSYIDSLPSDIVLIMPENCQDNLPFDILLYFWTKKKMDVIGYLASTLIKKVMLVYWFKDELIFCEDGQQIVFPLSRSLYNKLYEAVSELKSKFDSSNIFDSHLNSFDNYDVESDDRMLTCVPKNN